MDYHKDRFDDFSLMVFKANKLVALLPANRVGNEIHSHQGLSYGGLLLNKSCKFQEVLDCFKSVLCFLDSKSIQQLHLKLLPKIYNVLPSDEIDYLLFILNAKTQKKETLSVIGQGHKIKISKNRFEGVRRGEKHKLSIREESEFEGFWNAILSVNLKLKHDAKPVHTLEEIEDLKLKFPKNIRQFNVYNDGKLVAGTTIFESQKVAHCQYISGDEHKNALGSLDFLHHHLLTNVFQDKDYFDFGSSNEANGKQVNKGLQFWKEGFGARTIIQESFSVNPEHWKLLNEIMQ